MTEPVRVVPNRDEHRYEAWVGDHLAGFVDYHLTPGRIVLIHTETDDALQGQGIASRLAAGALDDARAHGWSVTPRCPFVAEYIRRHPEYADLVARPTDG